MAYYLIRHKLKKSYLSTSDWTSSLSSARRFDNFLSAYNFSTGYFLHDQYLVILRVSDSGYGEEIEEVNN
jgi:hypothetical protein